MTTNTKPQQDRYERFARNYVKTLNIKKAYQLSGFENDAGESRPYQTFKRKEVQDLVAKYTDEVLQKLDISVEKTLKHLAAIGYGNPLELMAVDEEVLPDGTHLIHGTRMKSPTEIPPYAAVMVTGIKEHASPDGGVTLEYKFEGKVPALKILLEHLKNANQANKETTIVVKHQGTETESKGPKVTVKL